MWIRLILGFFTVAQSLKLHIHIYANPVSRVIQILGYLQVTIL